MSIEKKVEEVGLKRHNELVFYAMQIYYLDNYKDFEKIKLTPELVIEYYLSCEHPKKEPNMYQTHIDFWRYNRGGGD